MRTLYFFAIQFLNIFLWMPSSVLSQAMVAGAAESTIHPERDSLYFAGAEKNRKFIDVEDGLYVKALVVSDGNKELAVLTFDCIGLMYPELEKIRKRVRELMPEFTVDNIVISSTHTHTGPDVVGLWGKDNATSGVNPEYMEALVETSAQTVAKAWRDRKQARVVLAEGSHGEDWVRNISEPDLIDRSVSVIAFRDEANKNIATLANFACHPTILIGVTKGGSSDFVAGYYQYLDSVQGGINMYLQGAIGGWVQPEDVPRSYANAMKYGSGLGKYTADILKKGTISAVKELEFRSARISLAVKNPGFRMLSQAGVITRTFSDSVTTEIACFSIGDALFATHPGETSPALSLSTKSLMKNKGPKFILGLGMDALGYILKPVYFVPKNSIPHSAYLTSMSVGPDTYPEVESVLSRLLTEGFD